ncbi:hypothetical protein [Kangiella sediminilitoris]|uniref:hypothetical protein n=1 Tax=Kangiella sediminilitoris TaxID=1144748 RepID=UPI00083D7129|nr:hypothetical protein [Kangiella sediminilitoris]
MTLTAAILLPQTSQAKINCYGQSFSDSVTRSDITGSSASDQSTSLTGRKVGSLVNGAIDLNIALDLESLINTQVTVESADWVWFVDATPSERLNGNITAEYSFLSVAGSNNQICSDVNVNSCMTVVAVEPIAEFETRKTQGANRGSILQRSEGVRLTLDLSRIQNAGNYSAQVLIDLYHDGISLACSN